MAEIGIGGLKSAADMAKAVANSQKEDEANGLGLASSLMKDPNPQKSLTTYTISDIIQGTPFYKPKGITADTFNQELSKELEDLRADMKDSGFTEDSSRLNPFDVFIGSATTNFKDIGAITGAGATAAAGAAANTSGSYVPRTNLGGSMGDLINSLQWVAANSNQPNSNAAIQFVKAAWPGNKGIGGYRSSSAVSKSDHMKGLATDNMVTAIGGSAVGAEFALGLEISDWFAANPGVFGLKYIIFMDFACYDKKGGGAWVPYDHPSGNTNTYQHRDHVHLSFHPQPDGPGPPGTPWPAVGTHPLKGTK